MLTENQYSRQGRPPYFSNFVVLTVGSTSVASDFDAQPITQTDIETPTSG